MKKRSPYDRLGVAIVDLVRSEAPASSGIERWKVVHREPLVIEQVDGEVVLEDGDPDFTIGDALRARLADPENPPAVGALVWVAAVEEESGTEWHAFDVVSGGD